MTISSDIYFPVNEVEKTFIKSIWWLSEYHFCQRKEIILPKGTVEIIFNFSDPITYINPSSQRSQLLPLVFINGINFNPFELIKTGHQKFLGIQLSATGLRLLFNLSPKEFNDTVYDGKSVCTCLESLAHELFDKRTFHEQVETILSWIRKRIAAIKHEQSLERVQQLMRLKHCHDLTVKKLSNEICLSDRQLRRIASDWLGMSTEEYILYNKYLSSLHLLHKPDLTLTDIGLKAGYYDQSHFIREFKSYTALRPKDYRKVISYIPGHIFA
jgi:AraC-like DNA-binding protein